MINLFLIGIELLLIGALGSLLFQRYQGLAHMMSSAYALIGSLLVLIFSGSVLINGGEHAVDIYTAFPFFTIALHVDRLSAFFLFIIALIAIPATLYGTEYMKEYFKHYNIGLFGFFYNIFLLSLFLVATAFNGIYFVFVWELMALSSLFLVLFEYKKQETIKAGLTYFLMTHISTGFLIVAFLLLYQFTGSFDFRLIALHSHTIPVWVQTLVFVCMIIGFGTKAGIIPLHIWLPKAHSAAPSHVSALMSGVMIKLGIYMLFRMFLGILPLTPLWLGIVVLLIGALSSVLGVLYALSEHDSKRLLAYHSIENVGIILLGLGSGLIFLSLHLPALAALAIIAGLFHTINHAVFKSLLFLGAGSVLSQTHTRNMELYGGLIKRMPYTAVFFLIGAIAISGLPPLNGFVSEWLTFQSLFAGILQQPIIVKSSFLLAGGALALTGGLAAACFVKVFGVTFLARPRSTSSEKAREVAPGMTVSMGFLATLCIVLAFASGAVVTVLHAVIQGLPVFSHTVSALRVFGYTSLVVTDTSVLSMPLFIAGMIGIVGLVVGFATVISYRQKIRRGDLWACGYAYVPQPRMEITATGFARTLIIIFRGMFRPTKQHTVEYVDADMRYFAASQDVSLSIMNIYEAWIYEPLHIGLDAISRRVKSIQGGNINQYLLYIFIALLGLLLWVRYY